MSENSFLKSSSYLVRLDNKFRIISVSNFCNNESEWDPDIKGKIFLKYIHTADHSSTFAEIMKAHDAMSNFQNRVNDSNSDEYVWVQWFCSFCKTSSRYHLFGITNKVLEAERHDSEKVYKHICDNVPAMLWMVDKKKIFYCLNKAWENYNQITSFKFLGWPENIESSDLKKFKQKINAGFKKKTSFQLECRIKKNKEDQYEWFNIKAIPTFSEDKKIQGFYGAAIAIDSYKYTENKLIKAVNNLSYGIWEWDIHTGETLWDKNQYRIFGVNTAKKITHSFWESFVLPEDFDDVMRIVREGIHSKKRINYNFRIKTPDGQIKYIEANADVILNDKKEVEKMIGTNQDATESYLEKEYLSKIYTVLNDSLIPLSVKLRDALRITTEYLGLEIGIISKIKGDKYYVEYFYDKHGRDLSSEVYNVSKTYCHQIIESKKMSAIYNVNKTQLRKHPCYKKFQLHSYIGIPLFIEDQLYGTLNFSSSVAQSKPFGQLKLDLLKLISGRIAREIYLRRVIDDLQQKNDSLQSFNHIISHDIKTPLRSLNYSVSLLEDDMKKYLTEKDIERFQTVKTHLLNIHNLINSVQKLSEIDDKTEKKEIFDLKSEIKNYINSVQYSFTDINVKISFINVSDKINSYKDLLLLVFRNLLTNSIKYNKNKNVEIEIGQEANGKERIFYIKDNGVGISKKNTHEIFHQHYTTHSINGKKLSSGMGLYFVKQTIESKGGRIWFESKLNKGSTFYFTI